MEKNQTEFDVRLSKSDNKGGSQSKTCRVPKPIIDRLHNPSSIKFAIEDRKITVKAGEK